jgi:hypothetical protein
LSRGANWITEEFTSSNYADESSSFWSTYLAVSRPHLRTCLFLFLAAFLIAGCKRVAPAPQFPPQIGDLERVKLVEGEEAIRQINKLHGKPIDVVRGFIAEYQGDHSKATTWVSEAQTAEMAEDQVVVMLEKMKSNPRSPFSNYQAVERRGTHVIAFEGLGQTHYVFRKGNWVYWIDADSNQIDTVLEHIQK